MYYVYVIKSLMNGKHYVGFTQDVEIRLKKHNSGKVRSTKAYKPYKLIHVEKFSNKANARKREIFLKTGKGRELIKDILGGNKRTGVRVVEGGGLENR